MTELQHLLMAFEEQQVSYLLCGGLAVNIHAVPRSTTDIDVLIDFSSENIESFLLAVSGLSYKQRLPI